ncbi:MAG: site-specific integrase [Planctomycetaceae bacterium]|nr:site-specific integrase [Planctomycetaceae bacterium]
MPKSNKPPKYSKNGKYAVIYVNSKKIYLGLYGSPESRQEYARIVAEWDTTPTPPSSAPDVSVSELAAGYLDYAQPRQDKIQFSHNKYAIGYLVNIYGSLAVNEFSPKKLKVVRLQMVKTGKMCRKHINGYVQRIVRMFSWGVEEELVKPDIVAALREMKSLRKGEEGTHDNPPREAVPFDVVKRTLPFMSLTVAAMVVLQWLTGMRPSEVYRMRVENIDRSHDNGLWYYTPGSQKTEKYIGKRAIPLGKPEQDLIAPYLIGKKATDSVFSPKTAMKEHRDERRTERKSKITPSQAERDRQRAKHPTEIIGDFYDASSYRKAVGHAIKAANKAGVAVPHWTPYQLRHSAGTEVELNEGLDKAQALLRHTSADTTKRYAHGQLAITEDLARNRKNPFESDDADKNKPE